MRRMLCEFRSGSVNEFAPRMHCRRKFRKVRPCMSKSVALTAAALESVMRRVFPCTAARLNDAALPGMPEEFRSVTATAAETLRESVLLSTLTDTLYVPVAVMVSDCDVAPSIAAPSLYHW